MANFASRVESPSPLSISIYLDTCVSGRSDARDFERYEVPDTELNKDKQVSKDARAQKRERERTRVRAGTRTFFLLLVGTSPPRPSPKRLASVRPTSLAPLSLSLSSSPPLPPLIALPRDDDDDAPPRTPPLLLDGARGAAWTSLNCHGATDPSPPEPSATGHGHCPLLHSRGISRTREDGSRSMGQYVHTQIYTHAREEHDGT